MNLNLLFSVAVVVLSLSSGSALAANSKSLTRSLNNSPQVLQRINQSATLKEAFNLSPHQTLIKSKSRVDKRGSSHTRYRQAYRGVPVWGEEIIINRDSSGKAIYVNGRVSNHIVAAQLDVMPHISADSALITMKARLNGKENNNGRLLFRNESSELVIFLNAGKPKLSYAVSFFADSKSGGHPTRPTFLVDAHDGTILFEYEGLTHVEVATGPGGNVKTGRYYFGTDLDMLDVDIDAAAATCVMNSTNVKTVNLNHGTTGSTPFSFTCGGSADNSYENTYQTINNAYSPLNDAHYFGGVVFDMYNEWLGVSPLVIPGTEDPMQLMLRVHYSNNYENAFWDGSSMTFGDGDSTFYPLVSLDVMAHEVSHGFTEQYSGLIYSGQSGGINESFSDIAGEAAEVYMKVDADFQVGADIKKIGALRYMEDPTRDGSSIKHAANYYNGMNVHYSSGVYNRAFYLLANTPGWNVKKAFILFATANQGYWGRSDGFDDAYSGLIAAATSLGYVRNEGGVDIADITDIEAAFAQVGIPKPPPGPVCNDSNIVTSPLANGIPTDNLSGVAGEWRCWVLDVHAEATKLDVVLRNTAKGKNTNPGDADLYIKFGDSPEVDPLIADGVFDCGSYTPSSDEICEMPNTGMPDLDIPVAGEKLYIAVYAFDSFPSVKLTATYSPDTSGETPPLPTGDITLTATEKGGRNNKFVSLSWTGATTERVIIYVNRDDEEQERVVDTENDGVYKDNEGNSSNSYQLCEVTEQEPVCSNVTP